jgi:hypothetical protein
LRGRGWALIPVGSIIGVIFAIRYASGTATWLTYLALVAVPILAAVALGGFMRGGRVWLALLVVPLFLLTWRTPHSLVGEGSGAILCGLSCVTLGVLLGAVTPARWLKLGIVAMAAADVWLVGSNLLQNPNNALIAAAPGGGLPQLQSELFGSVSLGYGDLFVAGLLGALLSAHTRVQRSAALLTLGLAAVFDLLFLVHKIYYQTGLPATVPVALALIVLEGYWWRTRRRGSAAPSAPSGRRGRSRPVVGTPPPAT